MPTAKVSFCECCRLIMANSSSVNLFSIVFFTTTNSVSLLVCLLAAILVFRLKLHTKVVYRLALYQVLAALAFATVEVLEIVFINDTDIGNSSNVQNSKYNSGCNAIGWLVVYTQWMKLLFTMWVTFHLFCFVVFYKNLKKLEVLYVVTSLLIPAVIACVPLITKHYAVNLVSRRCYINQHELVERILLWYAPAMVILLTLSIAMVVMVTKLLHKVCSKLKYEVLTDGDQFWMALKQLIPLAAYPILFLVFIVPVVTMGVMDDNSSTIPIEDALISNALFISLWSLSSGATLIVHITLARYFEIKRKGKHVIQLRYQHREGYLILR